VSNFINRIVQQYDFIDPMDLDTVLMRLFQAVKERSKRDAAPSPGQGLPRRLGAMAVHASALPDKQRPSLRTPAESRPCSMKHGQGNALLISKPKCENGPH
jgi:hypothetical protein